MSKSLDARSLASFLSFIRTGGDAGWEAFWNEGGEAFVTTQARSGLAERFVTTREGRTDWSAVEEVISMTQHKLVRIARGDLAGGFDATRNGGSPGSLAGWLVTVVSSQVHDYIRTHRCTRSGVKLVSLESLELNSAPGQTAIDDRDTEWRDLDETIALVRHVLNQLEETDRTFLRMAYMEGLSQRDIAERIGCGSATAYRRVHDARDRFEARLLAMAG